MFVAFQMSLGTESKRKMSNIKEGKDKEESGKIYIRRLQVAPSPACVLASDRQVQDVKRFCASTTNQCSILSTFFYPRL